MSNKILDRISDLDNIRNLSVEELGELAIELRLETIDAVSKTGGHLGAGLGVIELTIAIHYVFNTPVDQLIWDIGHQTYPHKILTGRRDRINTLRKANGLSGFTKRSESIYDSWGAGHSSTSISAALGMIEARDLKKESHEVIAVIGDGAMSSGMAYEAMNNAIDKRLILILNDNDMSIAKPVGAMSAYLSKLISSSPYSNLRNLAKKMLDYLPKSMEQAAKKVEKCAKTIMIGNNFFEELGFYYVGPVDGHNLQDLVTVLENVRNNKLLNKPILIHVITEKGKGFRSNINCGEKWHAVSKFDIETGTEQIVEKKPKTYTKIFAETLIKEANLDDKIIAITAAMPSGTGLNLFEELFPNRFFDVGIAEQHAVTFAAGLACCGMKPVVAIYSTFLQRAYDQIIHDVAIQKLPVRFAIDRSGLVGADGPTHAGSFDITFLATVPNMIIMAASNGQELAHMVKTSLLIDDQPSAFRYPRGEITDNNIESAIILPIGKGKIIYQGSKVAILSLGSRLNEAMKASKNIKTDLNIDVTVIDMRFAKPIDCDLIKQIVANHQYIITIEENSIGGFAAQVLNYIISNDLIKKGMKFRSLFFPDYFVEQNTQEEMYEEIGLNSKHIEKLIKNLIDN